jgi:uncharacterized membrane protein YbhN (UPF0104 family)
MCSIYLAFLAFNYEVSMALLFFVMPLLNFSEFLPFSINSLGIKEGVGIYLFSLFEVNKEIVLLVLLTSRALLAICSITGGLRYLVNKEIL